MWVELLGASFDMTGEVLIEGKDRASFETVCYTQTVGCGKSEREE